MVAPDAGASDPASGRPDDRLDSWKEIAAYLKREIRTVQRWEKLEGLPVHRHVHRLRGSAFAYRSEIDAWWATRRHDLQRADSPDTAVDGNDAGAAVGRPTEAGPEHKPPNRPSSRIAIIALAAAVALVVLAMLFSRQTASSRFQATDHRLLSDFPGGSGGPSLSPDGRMIAFHHTDVDDVGPIGTFQIWVKNVIGGRPLQLTFAEAPSTSPSWSPKGDLILFNHRGGIWSVSPFGGTPRLVIERGAMPRFSMDGRQIVFEEISPGRGIWIANADGSHRRQIAEKGRPGVPASPALSPDGRWVAYFQSEGGLVGDFWVAPSEGGTPRRLTFDSTEGGGPVWTPDGRFIIYYSSRAGSQTLWRVPAAGGTPEPVTSGAGQDRDPDISLDGKQLVYSNFRVSYALMLVDPLTGQQRELLQSRFEIGPPRFSSDGSRVAFSRQVDRDSHVFTIDVDGKDARQVTQGAGQRNLTPHWSNDGASLYFIRSGPTPSLRKISALGGESLEVASSPDVSSGEIDPFGRTAVYTRFKDERSAATVVRNLATGHEIVLDMVVNTPRWSPDAQTIVGWQPALESGRTHVVSCSLVDGRCQVVVEQGFNTVVMPDSSRLLFLRGPLSPAAREIWSIRLDGHDVKQIATVRLAPNAPFDVSRRGEIVFPQRRETRAELWRAELR